MSNNSIIKSPYNFVPLSDEVYTPGWANQIANDIPFKGGVSGKIRLRITAETPIFVCDGHAQKAPKSSDTDGKTKGEEVPKECALFSKAPDGRFYIPATSIKGEVRNVLEILSFGRMMVDERAKFAHREWGEPRLYPLQNVNNQKKIHCGWLRRVDGSNNFIIEDCGKPHRIHHTDMDYYFGEKVMEKHFSTKGDPEFNKKKDGERVKTTAYKYDVIEKAGLENMLYNFHYAPREATEQPGFANNCVQYSPESKTVGTIVMTGQSATWNNNLEKNSAKIHEFVFPNDVEKRHAFSKEQFEHFKFIYSRDEKEWKFISKRFNTEVGCPIFFRLQDDEIHDLGLAFMYKLPYDKSVYESLPQNHKKVEVEPDLAECIFGYINENAIGVKGKQTHKNEHSLKGRVQFGHAFAIKETVKECDEVRLTLSSPKASYYPMYIHQEERVTKNKTYKTYNNGVPSGWKRYVLKEKANPYSSGTAKTDTAIKPLKEGTTFECDITFHNLLPIELGALLSALTFHNTPECRHQLGQGKPYGLGRVKYGIKLSQPQGADCVAYMKLFEEEMTKFIKKWALQPQMNELVALASHLVSSADSRFNYMRMSNTPRDNEFLQAQQKGESLQPFTTLVGENKGLNSIVKQEEDLLKEQRARKYSDLMTRAEDEYAKDVSDIKVDALNILIEELTAFCAQHPDEHTIIEVKLAIERLEAKRKDVESNMDLNNKEESFKRGFATFIQSAPTVVDCLYLSQKWIQRTKKFDNGRKYLNQDEVTLLVGKIKEVYKETDKKDCTPKKGKVVVGLQKLIDDMTVMLETFNNLTKQ